MPVFTPHTDKSFPFAIVYRYRISTRSRIIYLTILLSFILILLALPFIYVEVSVKGDGILQPSIERSILSAPVSGELVEISISENQKISRGDTLLQINAAHTDEQILFLKKRLLRLEQFQQDISQLLRSSETAGAEKPAFRSGQYAASWQQFIQEQAEHENAVDQAGRALNRHRYLYNSKAITLSEFEKLKFEYDQALVQCQILGDRYRSQWQSDAIDYTEEIRQLRSKMADLKAQLKLYTLVSPFQGSVQNVSGLLPGSYVFANQKIAEISPDTLLLAYCYVRPADIGLIRKGQAVNFRVHAFNYQQWGLLQGRVTEISDDVTLLNNEEPVFKILCSLDKDFLQLGNTRGYLKKGMNFRASFRIAERSLFQLLYDQAEDWLETDQAPD